MAESYKISAVPLLLVEGEYQGRLNGVTFTATSATDTREWFTINCGQLEDAFTKLMRRSLAKAIVASLMEGDSVELPGTYQEEQFANGFVYEWSPVYFVRPLPLQESGYIY